SWPHTAQRSQASTTRGKNTSRPFRAPPRSFSAPPDGAAPFFYSAAESPAIGFVHGPGDVNPLNEAMLESYAESRFMNQRASEPHPRDNLVCLIDERASPS